MIELDVQLTLDGELVVFHDAALERCTNGSGLLREHTFGQLQALDAGFQFTNGQGRFPFRGQGIRILKLEEVLERFPGVRFNVEIKASVPEAEAVLAKVIRGARAVSRTWLGSENDEVAGRLAELLPEACLFYPRQALTHFVLAAHARDPLPDDPRFWVLDMPLVYEGTRLVDEPFLAQAAGAGRWVNVWTVDDPGEMRALIRLGVGGIMTDRPDLLRSALDQAGP